MCFIMTSSSLCVITLDLSLYYPSQLPAPLLLPPSHWPPSGVLSLFYYFHYLKRSPRSFMSMVLLPVYHMQEVFMKARVGIRSPWNWSYRCLPGCQLCGCRELKSGPPEEESAFRFGFPSSYLTLCYCPTWLLLLSGHHETAFPDVICLTLFVSEGAGD